LPDDFEHEHDTQQKTGRRSHHRFCASRARCVPSLKKADDGE
jgi:hypothetical protein